MDYEEVKQRIFYLKQMRDIHKKQSPIKGYGTAGEFVRELQRYAETVALGNHLGIVKK